MLSCPALYGASTSLYTKRHKRRRWRGQARPQRRASMADKTEKHVVTGERIAKVIARAGLASRREVEAWIAAGRVSINDAVITSPALNVSPSDRISVDGMPLRAQERTRLLLFTKPSVLVATHLY